MLCKNAFQKGVITLHFLKKFLPSISSSLVSLCLTKLFWHECVSKTNISLSKKEVLRCQMNIMEQLSNLHQKRGMQKGSKDEIWELLKEAM